MKNIHLFSNVLLAILLVIALNACKKATPNQPDLADESEGSEVIELSDDSEISNKENDLNTSIKDCKKAEDFYITTKDKANLFVKVQGNFPCGSPIIFLVHGGPFVEQLNLAYSRAFHLFSKHHRIVMLHQRGSGASFKEGYSSNSADLTVDLLVDDLKKAIDKVAELYKTEKFYLYSHSLGGIVSIGYLGKYNDQRVKAWIANNSTIYSFNQNRIYLKKHLKLLIKEKLTKQLPTIKDKVQADLFKKFWTKMETCNNLISEVENPQEVILEARYSYLIGKTVTDLYEGEPTSIFAETCQEIKRGIKVNIAKIKLVKI